MKKHSIVWDALGGAIPVLLCAILYALFGGWRIRISRRPGLKPGDKNPNKKPAQKKKKSVKRSK